ncbi:MAG: septum formation protein Maf [Spirochaetales bacterium]|nr:septum formation protein Maf [Spirochaetales bacterium]
MEKCPVLDEELKARLRSICPALVLASQSPNRLLMLRSAGLCVTPRPQDVWEICGSSEPVTVVTTLAARKMESYLGSPEFDPALPAVAVDTLVCLDGKLLGKPADENEARSMLRLLSGRTYRVYSGMNVYNPATGKTVTVCDCSDVKFRLLSEEDITRYISTGDPLGAAGAYKIQENGYRLIESISGSFSNIIGLPLEMLADILG